MLSSMPIHTIKADFFRALGHPMRVRILELLRDGDKTVGELRALTDLDSSSASQHLAALRRHGIVEGVREGTSVRYSVRDPLMFQLLEIARQMISANLAETKALLEELSAPEATRGAPEGGEPTQ
ncbi:MAG: ArsR/SmtB family transcription factor [Thermoleophilia bacterium]